MARFARKRTSPNGYATLRWSTYIMIQNEEKSGPYCVMETIQDESCSRKYLQQLLYQAICMLVMEQGGTVARGAGKSKAKHALANALSAAVNSLGPSGYPSIQMLAISLSQNKNVMTSKSSVALGFGALLELAEELI